MPTTSLNLLSLTATVVETSIVKERVVKSRQRVKAYGEVFTPRPMVDQMLDLVSEDLETGPDFLYKTFLEPAAGDGNFLVAIARRKIAALQRRLPSDQWSQGALFALASIYGIELLADNHRDAKAALLAEFTAFHRRHDLPCASGSDALRAAVFLIHTNIVCGNALTGLTATGAPIEFSWWHRVPGEQGDLVTREPFGFTALRETDAMDFTIYDRFQPCRIDQVHLEVKQ